MCNESSQSQNDKYSRIPFMRYLSSQNHRDQSIKVVAKGWGKRERELVFHTEFVLQEEEVLERSVA